MGFLLEARSFLQKAHCESPIETKRVGCPTAGRRQPVTPPKSVSLREVTRDTLAAVLKLSPRPENQRFVASNAVSVAQAHFHPEAWFRAVCADEEPVGFIMLSDKPEKPEYYLWRLMVDASHQRLGYGRRAVELLVDYVHTRPGATELLTSHAVGDDSPGPFYEKLGFVYTGDKEDSGELVMSLAL